MSLFIQQVNPTDSSNTASSILTTSLAGTRTLGCPELQGSDCHHLPRTTSGMHKTQMWNTNIVYHYGLKFTLDFLRNPNTHFQLIFPTAFPASIKLTTSENFSLMAVTNHQTCKNISRTPLPLRRDVCYLFAAAELQDSWEIAKLRHVKDGTFRQSIPSSRNQAKNSRRNQSCRVWGYKKARCCTVREHHQQNLSCRQLLWGFSFQKKVFSCLWPWTEIKERSGKGTAPGVSEGVLSEPPQEHLGTNIALLQLHLGRSQPADASWRSTSVLISAW